MSETPERKAYIKKWQQENIEKVRKASREWHRRNKEKCKELDKKYLTSDEKREKVNKRHSTYYHTKLRYARFAKTYGLTREELDYWTAIEFCQVCGKKFGMKSHDKRYIDHCHKSGTVRGVLCRDCNLSEGLMKSPENVLKLYEYMKRFEHLYNGVNL